MDLQNKSNQYMRAKANKYICMYVCTNIKQILHLEAPDPDVVDQGKSVTHFHLLTACTADLPNCFNQVQLHMIYTREWPDMYFLPDTRTENFGSTFAGSEVNITAQD